jgi:hypothetical protein
MKHALTTLKIVAIATLFALFLITMGQANAQTRPACKGTTSKGLACKSTIVAKSGYCFNHDPSGRICGAVTTSGKPCQRKVSPKSQNCPTHVKNNTK